MAGIVTTQRQVVKIVAAYYGFDLADLTGPRRSQPIADARHAAMWVVRECFPALSFPMIGRLFGGRDHTTAMHGVRRIEYLRERNPSLKAATDAFREEIGIRQPGVVFNADERARVHELVSTLGADWP